MTARQLILWRHGQTAYNAARRMQGQADIPLDETGKAQVAAAAQRLRRYDPELIVSSDLERARATADALASLTGQDVVLDARLRERSYGLWESLNIDEIKAGWPVEYQQWRAGADPQGVGIEPRPAAAARMVESIMAHLEGIGGTLVVTSHGGALTCAMTALLGLDPSVWQGLRGLDNAHYSVLWPNPGRSPSWRLVGHNA